MTKKKAHSNSWLEKIIIPVFVGLALASSTPWWFGELFKRDTTEEHTLTPIPSQTLTPKIPAVTIQEIKKQGYIFQLDDCRTTGEVGAVVCEFTVEAESERKDLRIRALDTFLIDPNGKVHFASRIDFGIGSSRTSANSDLIPGNPIKGTASFQNIPPEISYFREFELDGYIYEEGKLAATFNDVLLVD